MKDYMGVPLVMEPNFSDYSCQVNPIPLSTHSSFQHIDSPAFNSLLNSQYSSLNLGFSLRFLKMMLLSRSRAWTSALTPHDAENSPETLMYSNAPRHEHCSIHLQLEIHIYHTTRFERMSLMDITG